MREVSTTIDNAAEDAAFVEAMSGYGAGSKQSFSVSDLTGER